VTAGVLRLLNCGSTMQLEALYILAEDFYGKALVLEAMGKTQANVRDR
jgi:hypothetical protein